MRAIATRSRSAVKVLSVQQAVVVANLLVGDSIVLVCGTATTVGTARHHVAVANHVAIGTLFVRQLLARLRANNKAVKLRAPLRPTAHQTAASTLPNQTYLSGQNHFDET